MNSTTSTLDSQRKNRPEFLIGFLGSVCLGACILLFESPLILLGLLLAILGITVLWFWSDLLPTVVFLLLAFSVEIQLSGTTRLTVPTEPCIVLAVFLFFARMAVAKKIVYRRSPLNVGLFLMYFVMVLSLIFTWVTISTVKAIIRDTGYILMGYFVIPRYINSELRLRRVVVGCLIAHTLLVLYGFATQVLGGIHIYDEIASPFFIEHCIYAAFITMTFAFLLAYYLDLEPGKIRFRLAVLVGIFGVAIILTFVRAAWISVAFLLAYYLYQYRVKRSSVDLILILLVFLLIGIVLTFTTDLGNLFLQRVDTVADLQYVANYDRLDRWWSAFHMWRIHPVFGVGWGAYPDVYPYFIVMPNAYSTYIRMGAHNLYLEIMAETGLVGITVFLTLISIYFYQLIVIQRKVKSPFYKNFVIGMQGAMITYLVHAFLNNLGPSDKIALTFWVLMGMVPAMSYLAFLEEEATTPQSQQAVSDGG